MRRPRGVRTRLLITVIVTVAGALVLMTAGFNILLERTLSHDADSVLKARAATEAFSADLVNGAIITPDPPDPGGLESQAWVFQDGVTVEQPRAGATLLAAAKRAAASPGRTLEVAGLHTRLFAMKVPETPGVVVVAGVSLAPYEQTQRTALIASLVFAAALTVLVVFVARWLLHAALHPVARMTADAETWSEHDPGRRFAAGEPYDELSQLAATLDRLLDDLSASLLREQRFSAEVSHELRTPLARVRTEAELALRRERPASEYRDALQTIVANVDQMSRVIDTLVAAAQQDSGLGRGRSDVASVLSRLAQECGLQAAERGVRVEVRAPGRPLSLAVEADVAMRVLQPIVENGCRLARRQVMLSATQNGSAIAVEVDDDGPGVRADELESIFEPGRRGSAGDGSPGAGLGLALARRLARAAGGDVEARDSEGGRFVARLPRA